MRSRSFARKCLQKRVPRLLIVEINASDAQVLGEQYNVLVRVALHGDELVTAGDGLQGQGQNGGAASE